MTTYILDANVFIQAKDREYGFKFCPAFWDWLDVQISVGKVAIIDRVGAELLDGNDDLTKWAAVRIHTFLHTGDHLLIYSSEVIDRIKSLGYEESEVEKFRSTTDHMICAYALEHNCTVVTHEQSSNSKIKIKIPNVCESLSIPCIDPYEMLRQERPKFILEHSVGRGLRSSFIEKVLNYPEAA